MDGIYHRKTTNFPQTHHWDRLQNYYELIKQERIADNTKPALLKDIIKLLNSHFELKIHHIFQENNRPTDMLDVGELSHVLLSDKIEVVDFRC